jgi:hypothetical protein
MNKEIASNILADIEKLIPVEYDIKVEENVTNE